VLDFWVRSTSSALQFDIRFLDTKVDSNDHPWRMRKTINSSVVAWDGEWHHLQIPLKDFAEHGSWDNNTWYTPVGLFDWTAIDRFDIVAEEANLAGKEVSFDDIQIISTANAVAENRTIIPNEFRLYHNYPNPFNPSTTIEYQLSANCHATLKVYDLLGREVSALVDKEQPAGKYSVRFDAAKLSGGIYFYTLKANNFTATNKLVLMK
jgi:endoglucanase